MKRQKKLIRKKNWDIILVLDACRFDYFKNTYKGILEGDLKKARSPAGETEKWRKEVFDGLFFDDVIYVSANPFINSKVEVKGFDASRHFYKVIDVWSWGWQEELGTVPPREVNESLRKARKKYPDKKIIGHYLQPHAPYLALGTLGGSSLKGLIQMSERRRESTLPIYRIKIWVNRLLKNFLGLEKASRLKYTLGFSPPNPLIMALWKVGRKGLQKAYKKNLEIVLNSVRKIVNGLELENEKIIITSDHGELLGEGGYYMHQSNLRHPHLTEVPWLEIDKSSHPGNSNAEKRRIKRRVSILKEKGLFGK